MGLRIRLFGNRGPKRPAPATPPETAVSAAAAPPTSGAADVRTAPARPPAPVAIGSLTRYQHDPAFQNFQKKLRRPPGTAARRGLSLGDDGRQRQGPQSS